VHLARVRGERVVVKVQRPFLREIFDVDLKNIRVLAQLLQAADPKSDGAARDWVAIYDECSRILYQARLALVACSGSPPFLSEPVSVAPKGAFVFCMQPNFCWGPSASRRLRAALLHRPAYHPHGESP
jgi:hypothetical protein